MLQIWEVAQSLLWGEGARKKWQLSTELPARGTCLFQGLGITSLWDTELLFAEMDESMRSFAEKIFASEVRDEETREEISPFDVEEICPISRQEMKLHMMLQETSATSEKR